MSAFLNQKQVDSNIRNITNFSDTQKEEMIRLATKEKMSPYAIHKLHSDWGSYSAISRFLKRRNAVSTDAKRSVVGLEDRKDECISLYKEMRSMRKVAARMGVNKDKVDFCLQKYAPDIINRKPQEWDVNYFEKIDSPMKAYFLGFIATDGYLNPVDRKSRRLEIAINRRDIEVLEKLRQELKSNHNILYKDSVDAAVFIVSNNKFVADIEKYGITNNKSLSLGKIIENIPEEYKGAFITGAYDGDGCIHIKKSLVSGELRNLQIGLIGTYDFLKSISDWLKIPGYLYGNKNRNPLTWQYSFTKQSDVISFYKRTYLVCPFSLTRKMNKFKIATITKGIECQNQN